MKKINRYIFRVPLFTLVLFLVTVSCERPWLEPWPPDGARLPSDIWEYYQFSKGMLERVMGESLFPTNFNEIEDNAHPACASDEAKHSLPGASVEYFTNGVWSPTRGVIWRYGNPYNDYLRSPWLNSFVAIRKVNLFLENVDNSAIIDDPTNPAREFDRTWYKGQAYFLRAWFQFDLFRRYGAFPIITKALDLVEDDIYLPRNTLEECYNQIIADLDRAIAVLPYMYDDSNWHRPSKSIAQAVKARVMLYWASPLYQGDHATQPYGLEANTVGDVQRWKDVITAVTAAINENTFYALMAVGSWITQPLTGTTAATYTNILAYTIVPNQRESIWSTVQTSQARPTQLEWEFNNMPDGVVGARGLTNPTQEMVDAFEVVPLQANTYRPVAGQPSVKFDWNNSAHAANPYANRDPRFYHAINYNGVLWGTNTAYRFRVYTYEGGPHNDQTRPAATKTGYYMRKFLSETFHSYETGRYSTPTRFRNEIRLPELLLIYAEAMNEAYGPDVTAPEGVLRQIQIGTTNYTVATARDAVNLIRRRVEMPLIPLGLSQQQMRDAIRHEKRIEFCFESAHRMFDLRRWKLGEILGQPIHGIKITPASIDANGNPVLPYTYEVVEVEKRVWNDKMYWWPIPYGEIVKYNGKLKQNPGW